MTYIGKAGKAAQVKALVNMVMNINTAGLAEGLGLGSALGVDLPILMKVFSHSRPGAKSAIVAVCSANGAQMSVGVPPSPQEKSRSAMVPSSRGTR